MGNGSVVAVIPVSIDDLVIIECIDIAESERPDDLLGWRLLTIENPVEHCAVNALPSRPRTLASRSFYLRAKQANNVFIVDHTRVGRTDKI